MEHRDAADIDLVRINLLLPHPSAVRGDIGVNLLAQEPIDKGGKGRDTNVVPKLVELRWVTIG